jgi:hypothetical protein
MRINLIVLFLLVGSMLFVGPGMLLAQEPPVQEQQPAANTGINWWWLLPLLAIPLLIFMLPKREDTETQDQDMVGTKGGETKREIEEDNEF